MSDKEGLTFDKKESAEIGQALAAGMAAIEFLQEITVALEMDPKSTTVDQMLARVKDLIETEKDYDKRRDACLRGECRDYE